MPEHSAARSSTRADCARLRVVFAGTPPFAATSLAALLASEHEVVGVLTQPDRPAGRGRKLTPSAVKILAMEHGVPVLQPATLRDADAVQSLAVLAPDVLVVIAYGLILPSDVLALPPLGCINVHASLLPRWRGAAPVQRAILAGDAETGIGYMRMDAGLDTGDVLASVRLPLDGHETAPLLTDSLAELGAGGLATVLSDWCAGRLQPQVQHVEGITYAAKLDKREAVLDFMASAVEIDRRIRAFTGWPVAESILDGERVRIHAGRLPAERSSQAGSVADAVAETADSNTAPGTILKVTSDAIRVMTGDGPIELLTLQRPGGRAVDAATFAQGRTLIGLQFAAAFEAPV